MLYYNLQGSQTQFVAERSTGQLYTILILQDSQTEARSENEPKEVSHLI